MISGDSAIQQVQQWLRNIKESLNKSWPQMAAQAGISPDVLRRLLNGWNRNLPRPATVVKLTTAFDAPSVLTEHILDWVGTQKKARSVCRRVRSAQCRVCKGLESISTVQRARTFQPATSGQRASFVHRTCAGQPGRVRLVCPKCGSARTRYLSARRKRGYRKLLQRDGTYAVPCRRHNLTIQGKRQTRRLQRTIFEHQFEPAFRRSKYAQRRYHWTAEMVWEGAQEGDEGAERIRREIMATVAARARKVQAPNAVASPRRGPAISRGQVLSRWPSGIKGLRLCRLCGLLVHARKYHPLCWKAWMRSAAFQRERERRRWSPDKTERRPIDPEYPAFLGRLPRADKIAQKYSWFMQKIAGVPVTKLAADAGVAHPAVSNGIEDFKRWLPGDWSLVFVRRGVASAERANHERERLFPLREFKVRDRASRVRWLAEHGLAAEDIARLVGYSAGEVQGILQADSQPASA
jgi:hypothetical protein